MLEVSSITLLMVVAMFVSDLITFFAERLNMKNSKTTSPESRGMTTQQLKNLNTPQVDRLSDGVYNFQILQARRYTTRGGSAYANFDLVVLDGPHRHQRTNVHCFATAANNLPKVFGLGVLGTLAATDLEVTSLMNVQFEGCIQSTFRESDNKTFTNVLVLQGLGDNPPKPIPELAWNPPAGEYDFAMLTPLNYHLGGRIAGQTVDFEVARGRFRGYRMRKSFEKGGTTTVEPYLLNLGYRKRTKHLWDLDIINRLDVSYRDLRPRESGVNAWALTPVEITPTDRGSTESA